MQNDSFSQGESADSRSFAQTRVQQDLIRLAFSNLRTCMPQTKLTPSEVAIADRRSEGKASNVYAVANKWFVKSYLGGQQRTWGVFGLHEYEQAFRLADMIVYRFWKYRRDAYKKPTDDDFNITFNRAKLDNENEHDIVSSLLQIEAALIAAGQLREDCADKTRPQYKTIAGEFEKSTSKIIERLDSIDKRLDAIERSIDRRSLIPADYVPGSARPTLVYPPNVTPVPPSPQPYFGDPPTTPIGDQSSPPIFSVNISCATDGDGGSVS